MLQSPARRCSPGRDPRIGNVHRRGHGLEGGGGFPPKAQDDDLALFSEMQSRERENFLIHTGDDIDDSIAKLRYSLDPRLGIAIPVRGDTGELLNAVAAEKNDYDWLLTPPDTPLFASLDDNESRRPNTAYRGRQRSQPISISKPPLNDRRSSRRSASPQRLSPSPRTNKGTSHLRGTSYSSPQSAPLAVSRISSLPSQRSYSPSPRPSTPTHHRPTVTLPRPCTSSGQTSSSGTRGTCLSKSRDNSVSPKVHGWKTDLHGFSSNSSNPVRSLSPVYRRGRNSTSPVSRSKRQSMSPTPSRRARSSLSHEKDRFSSYKNELAVSSGDEYVHSLNSSSIGLSCSLNAGKNGMSANSSAMTFPKKTVRTPTSNAPGKMSFDSSLRQRDHWKTPHNMFRPLLSSVPTTFYAGKANRSVFSMNSSLTTSSNASSEQGICIVSAMECSNLDHNDLAVEWEKVHDEESHEDIFLFDKVDETANSGVLKSLANDFYPEAHEKSEPSHFSDAAIASTAASDYDFEGSSGGIVANCYICGKQFNVVNMIVDVCDECVENDQLIERQVPESAGFSLEGEMQEKKLSVIDTSQMQLHMDVSELPNYSDIDIPLSLHDTEIDDKVICSPQASLLVQNVVLSAQDHSDQPSGNQQEPNLGRFDSESKFQQPQDVSNQSHSSGTGISLLLSRSNSEKLPYVHGRRFLAMNMLSDSFSKRSISRDCASAASSIDLASSKNFETHVPHQPSCRKVEVESIRSDSSQISGLSNSGQLVGYDALCSFRDDTGKSIQNVVDFMESEVLEERQLAVEKQSSLENLVSAAECSSSNKQAIGDGNSFVYAESDIGKVRSYSESIQSSDPLPVDSQDYEGCISHSKECNSIGSRDQEVDSIVLEDDYMLNSCSCPPEVSANAVHDPCIDFITQDVIECSARKFDASYDSDDMVVSHKSVSESNLQYPASKSNCMESTHATSEEALVALEASREPMARSLTLEEAADTILFCSSIIHDLAYKAASQVVEKEEPAAPSPEAFYHTRKTNSGVGGGGQTLSQKDSRMSSYRFPAKPQKRQRKRSEAEAKKAQPPAEMGSTDTVEVLGTPPISRLPSKAADSMKPPKLESKCNCTVM